MNRRFDIVVVGAGMVGAAFACLLGNRGSGFSIAVVDGRAPPPFDGRDDYRSRVSAISRASSRILDAGGAWQQISSSRISPYRRMCVWDAGEDIDGMGTIRFDAADLGESELGHIVENELIQSALFERLGVLSDVSVICPATATGIGRGGDRVIVDLEDGSCLRARLVVGADGVQSPTRRLAGIDTRGHAYDQTAVICHVRTEEPHRETAWQRFLPEGPVALLPLADGRSSIVWSTTTADAERLIAASPERFLEELTAATDRVLGKIIETGPRFAFPLRLQMAESYIADRLALIGDAAHTVHPLAGQGVNLGLLDAAALAEIVIDASSGERDFGERSCLRRYERWRRGENTAAAYGIDAIGRLFRRPEPAIGILRRAGVALVDGMPALKNQIVRRAMGLTGDLPRFARPSDFTERSA